MLSRVYTDLIVTKLIAALGGWTGIEVGLYVAAFDPSPESKLADLTEATFTGYARVALGAGVGPVNPESQGLSAADFPRVIFTNTDPLFNGAAYGIFLADAATHLALYAVVPFAAPVAITGAGASVSAVIQGLLDPTRDMFADLQQ